MSSVIDPRATVPVTCPNCMHLGPAYLYLLGRMSRCKACKHDFLMPAIVRMSCPGCLALVRVPAEAIGRDVECRFCTRAFVASPDRVSARRPRGHAPALDDLFLVQHVQASPHILEDCIGDRNGALDEPAAPSCPGEHPVFVMPAADPECAGQATVATALVEPELASNDPLPALLFDQSGRIESLEHALAALTSDHDRLQQQLREAHLQGHESLRRELKEIEQIRQQEMHELGVLRARLGRLEEIRLEGGNDAERNRSAVGPSHLAPRSGMPTVYARGGSGARGHATKASVIGKHPGARPAVAHKAHAESPLREIIDRVSSCESITDRLITRLKTALDERERERAAFEQIIARMQAQLARGYNEREPSERMNRPIEGQDRTKSENGRTFEPSLSSTAI